MPKIVRKYREKLNESGDLSEYKYFGTYGDYVLLNDGNTLEEEIQKIYSSIISGGSGGGTSNVRVDYTLTQSGMAADSQTVGNRIGGLENFISNINGWTAGTASAWRGYSTGSDAGELEVYPTQNFIKTLATITRKSNDIKNFINYLGQSTSYTYNSSASLYSSYGYIRCKDMLVNSLNITSENNSLNVSGNFLLFGSGGLSTDPFYAYHLESSLANAYDSSTVTDNGMLIPDGGVFFNPTTTFVPSSNDNYILQYKRKLHNLTDNNITITEVGLYGRLYPPSCTMLLLYGKFKTPLVIPPHESRSILLRL